jgi:DedD protein
MMDRALKERIIGAAVLVAVAVLVVPVFLDGPPTEEEIISQSVALPGQSEQKTQTVVLDRNRTEPVPAANGSQADNAQARPAPARQSEPEPRQPVAKTAEDPPAAPASDPEPAQTAEADTSSTGMWAVQLGSFGNQENADRLVAELRKRGFGAFRSRLTTESGELHRVRVGPQENRDSAEDIASQLAKAGYTGQVVPHP